MDNTPLFKRPWFYIAGWLAVLIIGYFVITWYIDGFWSNPLNIITDFVVFFLLLLLWIAFFAQFVLPVRTFQDRQKIFDRLITYLSGGHGPAMFIRNGEIVKREGEEQQKGPGVVWLDSASAAVTRTPIMFKQVMGPGVHFLDKGESIAGTVDLHVQTDSIGPKETDRPFETQADIDISEYEQIQERRKRVSALTRDGIEVVPNISVTFRVDTGFPKENQPGSRFGFRTGITIKEKERNKPDQDAIKKAIIGEGINLNANSDSPRHRAAWNQLPTLLAVDIWREYVAKFTLDELLKPGQLVPPPPMSATEPIEEDIDPLMQPLQIDASQNTLQRGFISMLREVNKLLKWSIKQLDKTEKLKQQTPASDSAIAPTSPIKAEMQSKTALQVINQMVLARLTKPEVDNLNNQGIRSADTIHSQEHDLLQNRGLKVLNVNINNIRFDPKINETIIKRWSATWLKNAEAEREQIERKQKAFNSTGQEQAIRLYAEKLSVDLIRKQPKGVPETLKTLILRSRTITIEDEYLRKQIIEEEDVFEEIIKWLEPDNQ